jgi:hypothetical protein
LIILSLLFIGCDTKLGFLLLWVIYFLAGLWFNDWTLNQSAAWAVEHAFDIAMYIVAYLAIGVAWSVIKWYLFVLRSAGEYIELVAEFNSFDNDKRTVSWDNYLRRHTSWNKTYPPSALDNKSKIVDWIAFWWYSVFRTVLGDWMHALCVGVFNMFYNIFDAIAKSVFSGIETPKQ